MTTAVEFSSTNRLTDKMTNLEQHHHNNGNVAPSSVVVAEQPNNTEPAFPKATTLLFNTGNVVQSDRLRKRTNLNPQDELNEVLGATLSSWLNSPQRFQSLEQKVVKCRHPEYYEPLQSHELDEVSISVKLFLNSLDYDVVSQAIQTILEEIGSNFIDSLILSFPDKLFSQDVLPKESILPIWSMVQSLIDSKVVGTAGVADFNAHYLGQLLDSLEDQDRKPSVNQVNLISCCKMPEDLVELAKINHIQLTTHIDPKELLTVENLQSIIRAHAHDYDSTGWISLWVARYTLILKGRGIVKSKGYMVDCQRELKYTK